ncbi:MAG: helix-turn-helix transcriptional regulator [Dehalococcoidia bacterium]
MTVQIIERDRRPEWAVLPYEMYQQLLDDAETLQDIRDYEIAKKSLQSEEELIPSNVTYAILDGEKPIKVWRKYRGMTQRELSDKVGITKAYLSQIETGKRAGTTDVLSKLAKALGLTLDEVRSS